MVLTPYTLLCAAASEPIESVSASWQHWRAFLCLQRCHDVAKPVRQMFRTLIKINKIKKINIRYEGKINKWRVRKILTTQSDVSITSPSVAQFSRYQKTDVEGVGALKSNSSTPPYWQHNLPNEKRVHIDNRNNSWTCSARGRFVRNKRTVLKRSVSYRIIRRYLSSFVRVYRQSESSPAGPEAYKAMTHSLHFLKLRL